MKTGLIFDMDGTLWNPSEAAAKSWSEKVRQLGYNRPDITKEDFMGIMGATMDKVAEAFFGDLPEEERLNLLSECGKHENEYLRTHDGGAYPELKETLDVLSQKYDLFIVSNCQSGYIEAFLEFNNYGDYFKDIACYGDNLKVKSENIALIVERNGIENAYYIGDVQGDYDSSKAAGVKFIHAAYGFGEIDDVVPKIDKISDLPALMENILNV
ncbi:MAG: HAD family hydrolase [Candidatus Saccharibacteria bacterium]|nr:HAD family hydrolase [Candidatus Saccharibacteria bacterium]